MEQKSDEWYQARLGKVTASRVASVLAKKDSSTRADYLTDLVLERLTGNPTEMFVSSAMQWGTDTEPQARMAYEAHTNNLVDEVGFIDHPTIVNFGCSPDGVVGEEGLIEIKCMSSKNAIETLIAGKAPTKYIPQMQTQMAVMNRQWCDFVSFDPRLPEELQLFVIRVNRDDEYIAKLEEEVTAFLEEVESTVTKLKGLKDGSKETTKS